MTEHCFLSAQTYAISRIAELLKGLIGAVAVLLLPVSGLSAVEAERPNIVIIYVDDMGYGDLGVNNPQSKIPTPHLDRLAAQGMNFTDGHSSSGICTPSRYALLTGRHHWREADLLWTRLHLSTFGPSAFKENELTLPLMLRKSGYATACIGKWHLGWDWDAIRKPGTDKDSIQPDDFNWSLPVPGGPLAIGFDHYFGDDTINFPPYTWIEDDKILKAPDIMMDASHWRPVKEGRWECREGPAASNWDPYKVIPTLTQRAVDYILSRKAHAQPFFLYVALSSPHAPIIPNDAFDGKSQAGPYGDFVYETDDACNKILTALDEIGQADNTIVIFSSDNGAEDYAFERDANYDHWSSAPFRGRKRDIYEGGHHIPLIIRWPGVIPPGSVSSSLIVQTDLMATLASVVGYELPPDAAQDSYDFLPYLKGKVSSGPRTAIVHNTNPDIYALRVGDWVLVNAPSGYTLKPAPDPWYKKQNYASADDFPFELYNLKEDVGQRRNLAANHPEKVEQMQQLLMKLRMQGYTAPRLEAGHSKRVSN